MNTTGIDNDGTITNSFRLLVEVSTANSHLPNQYLEISRTFPPQISFYFQKLYETSLLSVSLHPQTKSILEIKVDGDKKTWPTTDKDMTT